MSCKVDLINWNRFVNNLTVVFLEKFVFYLLVLMQIEYVFHLQVLQDF